MRQSARKPVADPSGRRQQTPAETQARIEALEAELQEARGRETATAASLRESIEYQTATGDVLQVISRSTSDLQAVLDTLVETAARLCAADLAHLTVREGNAYRALANFAISPEYDSFIRAQAMRPGDGSLTGRTAAEARIVHIADATADHGYSMSQALKLGGGRTLLGVPLLRDGSVIGTFNLGRRRVEPFSDRQIELVRTFADQAVIAIENARLINETREALEQQTATAEVLQVINASPGELAPVFDAILKKAMRLCEAAFGTLWTHDGDAYLFAAQHGAPAALDGYLRNVGPVQPGKGSAFRRLIDGNAFVQFSDIAAERLATAHSLRAALVEFGGARTMLLVSLRKDDTLLGAIHLYRRKVLPFSEKQIALLQNFAAQAVIAIENARLITETREALEQQTATTEVLQVINSSPGNLTPVFEAMLDKALYLCEASFGHLVVVDGETVSVAAQRNLPAPLLEFMREPMRLDPGTLLGRCILERRVLHTFDNAISEAYRQRNPLAVAAVELGGVRTVLHVPLITGNRVIGVFNIFRQEVRRFSDKQIALLQNFAAQAVIAIENARLLDEIRQRQAELRITFDNMADGVVMFDEEQRLAAWNRNFQQMLDLPEGLLADRPTYADYLRHLADCGEFGGDDVEAELSRRLEHTDEELRLERTRPDGRVVEVRRNTVAGGGMVLIYSDITERKRSEEEVRAARDAAEAALSDLKAAQANLIQAEKMASLGQLTAGIAHEIKNPLNFVNNFAELSIELLDELKTAPPIAAIDKDARADIDHTIEMLTSNLEKIAEHGKRADGIVRSMLEHSRGVTGERREIDLNSLVEEALNLAYHGARAQDAEFNITLERQFDEALGLIEVAPQEMTRVFLNLLGNGFYAANKRIKESGDASFHPVLTVTTHDLGEAVEVRIRDNGSGIPPEIRDKMFQPFFTTKPTGEGTGLGLSISYDIVTQQHGGSIEVESEPGDFTEFTVRLPRQHRAAERA